MPTNPDYGPPSGSAELRVYSENVGQSFVIPAADMQRSLDRMGIDTIRLLRAEGKQQAGLFFYRMGQWFGGRVVPSWGIAGVVVAPQARSSGAGLRLMRELLLEARGAGVALSSLYPATQPVYRKAGYEVAGSRTGYKLPVAAITLREKGAEVRPATDADRALYAKLYAERAKSNSGMLERDKALWGRLEGTPENPTYHYVIEEDGKPTGYFIFSQKRAVFPLADYTVMDHCTLTPVAARRMLAFFASHWSTGDNLVMFGAPLEPVLLHLAEQKAKVDTRWDWMLRIVDLQKALEARGYPDGATAKLEFAIEDDVLADNAGKWTLEVSSGKSQLIRGGKGRIKLHIRALAPLYSGALSPAALVRLGWLDAPEEDLGVLAAVFAGSSPWMMDFF
ncbi:MAG: GNAT family N-acetyltransferase [Planctomycetes bacterium]|nr:GNAT family N-acetyltransferase [Planctomycetota bacterium]